jgi:type VI secretion system secreted protein VgrG
LVLDDTAGAGRVELSSTSAQTHLQLGHLLNQEDNRRLHPRGHGVELSTQAGGALRAAQGLLISAHHKPASAMALDAQEPRAQLEQSRALLHSLAESAQQQGATLEPDVVGAGKPDDGRQLPVERGLFASDDSWAGTERLGGHEDRGLTDPSGVHPSGSAHATTGMDGGAGTVPAFRRPDLLLAAPAGMALHTPASFMATAGRTLTLVAAQDLQHTVQVHHSAAAQDGVVLYTYGKAGNAQKPNTEVGMSLHAASGTVNLQSQRGALRLTADRLIEVASTQAMVRVAAPQHVLLTAAGAALKIAGNDITLSAPGKVELKAALKELGPGATASAGVGLVGPQQAAPSESL